MDGKVLYTENALSKQSTRLLMTETPRLVLLLALSQAYLESDGYSWFHYRCPCRLHSITRDRSDRILYLLAVNACKYVT